MLIVRNKSIKMYFYVFLSCNSFDRVGTLKYDTSASSWSGIIWNYAQLTMMMLLGHGLVGFKIKLKTFKSALKSTVNAAVKICRSSSV